MKKLAKLDNFMYNGIVVTNVYWRKINTNQSMKREVAAL